MRRAVDFEGPQLRPPHPKLARRVLGYATCGPQEFGPQHSKYSGTHRQVVSPHKSFIPGIPGGTLRTTWVPLPRPQPSWLD